MTDKVQSALSTVLGGAGSVPVKLPLLAPGGSSVSGPPGWLERTAVLLVEPALGPVTGLITAGTRNTASSQQQGLPERSEQS